MRKTRDLFKETGDIKGTFHASVGTIKDRNGKDLMVRVRVRVIYYYESVPFLSV